METKEIIKLSEECLHQQPERVERLAGAGSGRRYYRLVYGAGRGEGVPPAAIATVGDDRRENSTFCRLADVFGRRAAATGLFRVPRIYAVAADAGCYLQEDFGDESLFHLIYNVSDPEPWVKMALDGLLAIQGTPAAEWEDVTACRPFGERRVRWDLNYFKYAFIKPCGLTFDEERLEDDFERLASAICRYPAATEGFMYRDFQSRNVMVTPDLPGFIDFQGGMRGPAIYDAVSFLWQARAGFAPDFRDEMMDYYLGNLSANCRVDKKELIPLVDGFVLLRTLQVLGAYGFRGLIEKKSHFIESIPGALANLSGLVEKGALDDYPELLDCCRHVIALDRFRPRTHTSLLVEIWSFSFKKGYPENLTGNGGGFVFDCRGMHNPGRYEEYKKLSGADRPVIEFLEKVGEVQKYMDNVKGLVFPTIETYMRRGFKDLQVAFGCTGGQHRSVYCANALARLIGEEFPEVEVKIIHREQK